MRQRIRLTESSLHRIIKETVMRVLNEVGVPGGSGRVYSLHGDDPVSWWVLSKLRGKRNDWMRRNERNISKRDHNTYNWMRDEGNFLSFPEFEDDGEHWDAYDKSEKISKDIASRYGL